ncbi:hypothetical protein GCM10022215_34250 [Nocardioides fonticola]|uniref:Sigma-70 family RNA polymerase sigma factor n=1 Tax=Nocardioides fonticola TaxID=450363 RepID=A0ABP7XTY3_9ACTN
MDDITAAFTACWERDAPRVLGYAHRHIGADEAPDVVAEVFLVAWRRWDEVPDPPIGWLIRTASGVLRNRLRSTRRAVRLTDRIALLDAVASTGPDTADAVVRRAEAIQRLAALPDDHREAVLLVSWDGLSMEAAAEVAGVRPATFRKRLSRARERLQREESPLPPSTPALSSLHLITRESL